MTNTTKTNTTNRNRFIDVLKGIFIIFVIVLHFGVDPGLQRTLLFPYWCVLAVPCFMFLSGYLASLSFQRKGFRTLREMYAPLDLICRLFRFVIPFTIAYFAQWIIFRLTGVYLVNIVTYGLRAFCYEYLAGGKGQGSYYFPIMIQFVILFPLIYAVIRRFRGKGLAAILLLDEAYEIIYAMMGWNPDTYRIQVFRYLFIIAAGTYFALRESEEPANTDIPVNPANPDPATPKPATTETPKYVVLLTLSLFTGAFFIWLFSYSQIQLPIPLLWTTTSAPASLFVIPILTVLIRRVHRGFAPLELLGKASFNIFLTQMIYYSYVDRVSSVIGNRVLLLPCTILICATIGILFYLLESRLTAWIISKIKKCTFTPR
jgi:peptidoglycan/LPS O-acetylase OafA/YrhL